MKEKQKRGEREKKRTKKYELQCLNVKPAEYRIVPVVITMPCHMPQDPMSYRSPTSHADQIGAEGASYDSQKDLPNTHSVPDPAAALD